VLCSPQHCIAYSHELRSAVKGSCSACLNAPAQVAMEGEVLVNLNAAGDDHVSFFARHLTPSRCGRFLLVSVDTGRMLVLRAPPGALTPHTTVQQHESGDAAAAAALGAGASSPGSSTAAPHPSIGEQQREVGATSTGGAGDGGGRDRSGTGRGPGRNISSGGVGGQGGGGGGGWRTVPRYALYSLPTEQFHQFCAAWSADSHYVMAGAAGGQVR
jgi:hypothetical protein